MRKTIWLYSALSVSQFHFVLTRVERVFRIWISHNVFLLVSLTSQRDSMYGSICARVGGDSCKLAGVFMSLTIAKLGHLNASPYDTRHMLQVSSAIWTPVPCFSPMLSTSTARKRDRGSSHSVLLCVRFRNRQKEFQELSFCHSLMIY